MRNRFEAAGAIHHVVPNGNGGHEIVLDARDCFAYMSRFGEVVRNCGWIVHSSCLMSTHHHAVVETPTPNLGEGLRRLQGGHARWFNAHHRRSGNLFAQHCWSRRIVDDQWFVRACLYVVLNPVAAGLCRHPREWRWSSYTTTADGDPTQYAPGEERLLGRFGDTPRESRRGYAEVVERGVEVVASRRVRESASLWRALGEVSVLGSTPVSD